MRVHFVVRSAIVLGYLLPAVPTLAAAAPSNPASRLSRAVDLGATSSTRIVTVTAWLRMRQGGLLEQTVQSQSDPASPGFEKWSSEAAVRAAHAPTVHEAEIVQSFLASSGLTVTGVGPNNLFVSARGTVEQVQAALHVELHDYQVDGRTFFANTQRPALPSNVQSLVAFVGGLNDLRAEPMVVRPMEPDGSTWPQIAVNPAGLFLSAGCFRPPQTVHFSSADADATYSGNRYGQDVTNTDPGTLPPCGYQPSEVQAAYGLDKLYRAGLDGRGQTVAIVVAFGSMSINQDLATFSAAMGLPAADLTVIGTPTANPIPGTPNANWAVETTLDVEWIHAIAPRARIVLVVTEDNISHNLVSGVVTAAAQPGVGVISNSWLQDELGTDPEYRAVVDDVFKSIASRGIAINFCSGDYGDNSFMPGFVGVGWPASSPWVTAVGGVSLSLRDSGKIAFQTAWGNNFTEIDLEGTGQPPADDPFHLGFFFGGGGGISDAYAKPRFQRRLSGDRRQVPDISWLADPYTGVEIVYTGDPAGGQYFTVVGGTSLACPMFSGLWAIAAQRAGHNLGQAAPRIYDLDDSAITDVKGFTSRNNVTGTLTDARGTAPWPASFLAAPLRNLPDFYSALYNSGNSFWYVITFGTDSTLAAKEGYDLATGLGTPNGPDFVEAVARGH